ncbi:MAG TPA: HNH endonuclease [Aliarcobacter sp.]|nr:HNH endonuclease [Aliarcobacter sp.]
MFYKIKKLFKNEKEKDTILESEESEEKIDRFQLFLNLVDIYLKREFPNISFDLFIYENEKEKENLKVQKAMVIGEIVRQFADFQWRKRTQISVKKELIWSGYGINSQPNKKIPQDFFRRKELIFFREQGICNRCGNTMDKVQKISIVFVQEIEENGGYNVENLILLCSSCFNLIKNEDKDFSEIPLKIRDDLYDFI